MTARKRTSSRKTEPATIEPTSAVKMSLIQAGAVVAMLSAIFAAYYKLNGSLDTHTMQINQATETQARIVAKVDGLNSVVNDLHEKAAVSDSVQKTITDKLTDITNKIGNIQTAVQPRR